MELGADYRLFDDAYAPRDISLGPVRRVPILDSNDGAVRKTNLVLVTRSPTLSDRLRSPRIAYRNTGKPCR